MKDTLIEIKNNLQGNNSRADDAKNQINDLEHKEAKNNQLEQEEKRIHIAMVACGGVNPASKGLQYVEYSLPSTKRLDVEMDQGLPRSLIAVGLGVAAFAFAGHCVFQIWKPLEQLITETAQISSLSLSFYYKGGFEQTMSRREAKSYFGYKPIC